MRQMWHGSVYRFAFLPAMWKHARAINMRPMRRATAERRSLLWAMWQRGDLTAAEAMPDFITSG